MGHVQKPFTTHFIRLFTKAFPLRQGKNFLLDIIVLLSTSREIPPGTDLQVETLIKKAEFDFLTSWCGPDR
jgi:hypothetical protein